MCTFLWWPILYTYILLETYSARTEIFDGYFVHILPHVWPILDKYHVFILIRTLVTFVAFFIFFSWRHIMSWPRPYLWWSILYTYLDRVTYSVHMELFDGFLYTYLPYHFEVPPLHEFVSILLPFMANFVYLLLLNELFIWVIFTFGHSLVIYSVHRQNFCTLLIFTYLNLRNILWQRARPSGDLFCTHTYHEDLYYSDFYGLFHLFLPGVLILTYFMVILWWPILYTYFYLGDLFCTYGFF